MSIYNFLTTFTEPREVCVTTMETHNTPIYMYYTLLNWNRVSSVPTGNGFIKRTFRLKLEAPTGHKVTMILEEESNGDVLVVPMHFMHIEGDYSKKPYFLTFAQGQ